MVSLAYTEGLFCAFFWLCQIDARTGARRSLLRFSDAGKEETYDDFDACITRVARNCDIPTRAFPQRKVIVMAANQPVDLALVGAYLHNLQLALVNDQPQHAELLLAHTLQLLAPALSGQHPAFLPTDLPIQFSAGVGLDPGKKRQGKPNEDFVFAAQGTIVPTQEPFGLFVVADGMGGHVNGQEASHLAIETIVDEVLPRVREGQVDGVSWGELLRHGVECANAAVYQRNQQLSGSSMGTTVTAALIVGPEAFVANVGDSRTYLYRPGQGLAQLTRDHSTVAQLVEMGAITREEIYIHPRRNEIYRSLGASLSVEVDVFRETLQDGDALLLCSDGLWEMVPDEQQLVGVLSSSWASADYMAERLVQLALAAGGLDNIGLVVVRVGIEDITGLQTITTPRERALLSA
jgi:serine/threonine protein phosphatase PrpC